MSREAQTDPVAESVRVQAVEGSYRLAGSSPELGPANEFLEAMSVRGMSVATIRAYAYDLLTLFRWLHSCSLQLAALDSTRLLEFIDVQRRSDAEPASINRRLTTCEQLYRFVTGTELSRGRIGAAPHYKGRGRDHLIGLHQLKRVGRLKLRVRTAHKLVEPMTVEQVAALLGSLRRYRDLAIVYLMLLCGLRCGEVLSLRLSDLNFAEGRLRVRGKGNRERSLPLAAMLNGVIGDYLRVERPAGTRGDGLFVVLQGRCRGGPMTPAGLRSLFRHRRRANKGLRNANPHRLRHTFGADMARAGVRLPILQRMMGHADGKTTLQYINLSMADVASEYARAVAVIEKRYAEQQR